MDSTAAPYGHVRWAAPETAQPPTLAPHGVIAGHALDDVVAVARIEYVPCAPLEHCAAPDWLMTMSVVSPLVLHAVQVAVSGMMVRSGSM
jgi:hypothetical protein